MENFAYRFDGKPDYGFLTVTIPQGRTLKVEAAAMATLDTNIRMKTRMRGGFRRFLGGESLFINEFTAENGPGEIGIAPAAPGDIDHVCLDNETIYLQSSGYVASDPSVVIETKWQGLVKGFFSGESLFLVKCSGSGDLWFNTYGGMLCVEVDGSYVVDTGHMVAFTGGLDYKVGKVGGYKALFLSGEGLVCRFTGKGKVWIQTRQVPRFARWAWPFRPVKSKN
ncbi:MAG: TIGR00266 family protein [Kiritimatiellia bacterium]